jgi:hypothetical protein
MVKTTLKTALIFLFLLSPVWADDTNQTGSLVGIDIPQTVRVDTCQTGSLVGRLVDGTPICLVIDHVIFDISKWVEPPPGPQTSKPDPTPWDEILMSQLVESNPQREPTEMIKDVQVLAAISLLAKGLSLDLQKSFYLGINSTARKILPEELEVKFSPSF